VAWAGAAQSILCQGRFRRLVLGGGGNGGGGEDGVDGGEGRIDGSEEEGSLPARTPPQAVAGAALAASHARQTHAHVHARVPAQAQYAPDEGQAVRLDASTVQSLHLLHGGGADGAPAGAGAGAPASCASAAPQLHASGSLLGFLDATVSCPGRRRLREWVLQPLRCVADISARHDALDALLATDGLLDAVRGALAAAPLDAQRGVARAVALGQAGRTPGPVSRYITFTRRALVQPVHPTTLIGNPKS